MQSGTMKELDNISNEPIDILIPLLDNLKRKIILEKANVADTELLVQQITNLSKIDSKEGSISVTQSIQELSGKYAILIPFLMKIYKEVKYDQIKLADQENLKEQLQNSKTFTRNLRLELICPLLLGMADSTQNFFTSKYFGKIPIVSKCDNDIYATSELYNIDLYLKDNMNLLKTNTGCLSALQPYALIFRYLNKENEQIPTSLNNKTCFNYLVESAGHDQSSNIDDNLPRLIFVSDDVISMFLSDTNRHMSGLTLQDKKIILISIDKKNNFDRIIKSIIHEMQHLYNSYLFNEDNQEDYSKYLSNEAINLFIELTNSIKDDDIINIVRDIQNILHAISRYKQQDRDIDELSAHLTVLLFTHPDFFFVRLIIDLISSEISKTSELNSKNEALLVCKAISDALVYVENTIRHLSISLINFKTNVTMEFLDAHFEKNPALDEVRMSLKNEIASFVEGFSWDELIEKHFDHEAGNEQIVTAISYIDPSYSLFEQVKIGNNKMVMDLLQISKAGINELDKFGYSLLAYSVMNNHVHTFNLLLQFGASLEWKGKIEGIENCNLLHLAAHLGCFKFIPLLLDSGLSAMMLNERKQIPITLLTKFIISQSHIYALENDAENKKYNMSIKALAYLLCYSHDQNIKYNNDPENNFYFSLTQFRKNIALLYVLHNNRGLRLANFNIPNDIISHIALQFHFDTLCKPYKNCYRDISLFLLSNNLLFNKFIMLGMQSAFADFQIVTQNNMNPLDLLKRKFDDFISNTSSNKNPLSQDEIKQLSNYYYPRNLLIGSVSLSAVTLAQKELRGNTSRPFFEESRYNERRLTISKWKKRVENNEDDGLALALIQVFNELSIKEIDSQIYHKLSSILNQFVIKDNKTPKNYNPQLFVQDVVRIYQEPTKSNQLQMKK